MPSIRTSPPERNLPAAIRLDAAGSLLLLMPKTSDETTVPMIRAFYVGPFTFILTQRFVPRWTVLPVGIAVL